MSRSVLILFCLLFSDTSAQFGEIASLATSLLGGALGNGAGLGALAGAGAAGAGAAGQAGGALAQIGQLYQLAQGALQLTGTGVGVLNQASEGNWFPAVLEQTAKNSQALMKSGQGVNLGALGPTPGKGASIGPEFGTSFPAPDIDDYDENAEIPGVTTDKKTPKAPDGLVDIEEGDYELETSKATTVSITTTETSLSSTPSNEDEEETTTEPTTLPPRQIRIQLPGKNGQTVSEEDLDYEDLINKKSPVTENRVLSTVDAESQEEVKNNIIATHGTKTQPIVPKLDKLVEVLQKSKLSREEIDEIVAQVEGNKHIEKPAKYDFNAAVQNIPDKKNKIRQKITDASRIISNNFENQRETRNIEIQKQVDEFKVLPDLTETIAHTKLSPTTTTSAPTIKTTVIIPTTIKAHVQQTRSVPTARQVFVPPAVLTTSQRTQTAPNQVQVQQPQPASQTQPLNAYLQPKQQPQLPQQQQLYFTQAPIYGQQTQNFWGQSNQFVPEYGLQNHQQPNSFGYSNPHFINQHPYYQATPQPQIQNHQYFLQNGPQQQYQQQQHVQQPFRPQTYYAANAQQQVYIPQQQVQHLPPVQQKPLASHQHVVYQQGNAFPTPSPPPQKPISYVQPSGNTNQVVHYYHDGRQIVQQIIPRQIAAHGSLPLDGPFRAQTTGATDPVEYQQKQKALQQAYNQPETRKTVPRQTAHASSSDLHHVKPRIFESTVKATGHRQAHAIRTYQATKPTGQVLQPPAATRSSGRVSSTKRRISGHVLPEPTIDHRNILEKRTTAKPRYVRVP